MKTNIQLCIMLHVDRHEEIVKLLLNVFGEETKMYKLIEYVMKKNETTNSFMSCFKSKGGNDVIVKLLSQKLTNAKNEIDIYLCCIQKT